MNRKGFLITGIAILLSLTLVTALAYVMHSQKIIDSSAIERMTIDRTNNRATDVYRIIDAAALDAINESGCSAVDARLAAVLTQAGTMMVEDGITMSCSRAVVLCNVSVTCTFDSPSLHKEIAFVKTY